MTLPRLHSLVPNENHRAQLARWLQEWSLFEALAGETSPGRASCTPLALDHATQNTDNATGDIRLLHPCIEPMAVRYVAVLEPQGGDRWLVAPFGLLSEPATADEVRTDREISALRVLCPWNRFVLTAEMLKQCWLVGQLTEAEQRWTQTEPPVERVGPPLRHPLDPRWDYLEMEAEFRQRACSTQWRQMIYDISTPSELRKAAEDSAPYGSEAENEDRNSDT